MTHSKKAKHKNMKQATFCPGLVCTNSFFCSCYKQYTTYMSSFKWLNEQYSCLCLRMTQKDNKKMKLQHLEGNTLQHIQHSMRERNIYCFPFLELSCCRGGRLDNAWWSKITSQIARRQINVAIKEWVHHLRSLHVYTGYLFLGVLIGVKLFLQSSSS